MKCVFRTDERPGRLSQLHLVNMTKFAVAAKYHDERCADAAPHRGLSLRRPAPDTRNACAAFQLEHISGRRIMNDTG